VLMEDLSSFELFIGIYACLIGAILALLEVRDQEHMLWWKAAAIQASITASILMMWIIIGFIRGIIHLIYGGG
jgi:hypothetical protein